MKTIILLTVIFLPSMLCAKQIILNIPDNDIKIVENDVIDAEKWIKDAWAGKLSKCKERVIGKEVEISVKNREAIPAGDTLIIEKHFARPDYKSRKEKEQSK